MQCMILAEELPLLQQGLASHTLWVFPSHASVSPHLHQHQRSPKGQDNQAGDNEDSSEDNEDVVARVPPASIVEHLGRLKGMG